MPFHDAESFVATCKYLPSSASRCCNGRKIFVGCNSRSPELAAFSCSYGTYDTSYYKVYFSVVSTWDSDLPTFPMSSVHTGLKVGFIHARFAHHPVHEQAKSILDDSEDQQR
jgi:hypothetical protein